MSLPHFIEPQLATLTKGVPVGDEWLHEIKYDGYRMLGRLDHGHAQLLSRRAKEWSREFPVVTSGLSALRARRAIVDGEVAAFLPDGSTSFQALQNAGGGGGGAVLGYVLFDLLFLDDEDLRQLPLEQRKARLGELVAASASPVVRFADHIVGRGSDLWSTVCDSGTVEGLVSKLRTSRYTSGRSSDWLKTKCVRRGEFVVGGFTEAAGRELRGLLVGTYIGDELVFAGRVGAALPERQRSAVFEYLDQNRVERPPFSGLPDGASVPASRWGRASATPTRLAWVRPELVVEVEYLEWTEDDVLRHPVLKAILPDRKATDVRRR
jgi:bifunctional non-homologous end joining protein LigD